MLNSGVELIEQLKSGTPSETTLPDVILLDLYMENMNGWEALDIMKNENFSIPVIIVSNSDSKSDLEKSTSYPAVKGYFKKGDYPAALIDLINSMESTT
jgi:CheY-like chemotaxis protein